MAISKNTYSTSHSIDPYLIRVTKDTTETDYIVIDDIEYGGSQGSMSENISGNVVWLQVEINNIVTQLLSAPSHVTPFTPSHESFSKSRILIKSAEVFVVLYKTTEMSDPDDREEVTGYQLGTSSDILYVKIDHAADTITLYYQ
jgi:hypothetical protein